jgi:hypothetical protein
MSGIMLGIMASHISPESQLTLVGSITMLIGAVVNAIGLIKFRGIYDTSSDNKASALTRIKRDLSILTYHRPYLHS